jgi:hypothetical protein
MFSNYATHSIWLVWIEVLDSSPQRTGRSWFSGLTCTITTITEVHPPTNPRTTQLSTGLVELLPSPLTWPIPPPLPTVSFSFYCLVAASSLPWDRVHGGQWWSFRMSAGFKATLVPSRRLSRPRSIVKSTTKVRHLPELEVKSDWMSAVFLSSQLDIYRQSWRRAWPTPTHVAW